MTGTPMLWAPMASVAGPTGTQQLIDNLKDNLLAGNVTALEAAQFEIQLGWLQQAKPSVPEVEIIFANIPGTPGLPLGDGQLGMWMPSSHVVSVYFTSRRAGLIQLFFCSTR